jgi:hypothetical protein
MLFGPKNLAAATAIPCWFEAARSIITVSIVRGLDCSPGPAALELVPAPLACPIMSS